MLLSCLLLVPLIGIFLITSVVSYQTEDLKSSGSEFNINNFSESKAIYANVLSKNIALISSIINLIISLLIYILFDFNTNQFQFVQEHYNLSYFDIYLGIDGISIYFIMLTTIIMPIALLSN
jgi:NADH:ubiquinone oxidoreductase subunit 4 (subunit M)